MSGIGGMADTPDLKSEGLKDHIGSSPISRTKHGKITPECIIGLKKWKENEHKERYRVLYRAIESRSLKNIINSVREIEQTAYMRGWQKGKRYIAMNNKEAALHFRNEMLAGNGLNDVDLPKFQNALGINNSKDEANVPGLPAPVATLQVPNRIFETFDGKEWKEVDIFTVEVGQKVIRITEKGRKL